MELLNNQNQNERPLKGSFVFWLAIMVTLIGLDQITKFLAFLGQFGKFLNAFAPYVKKFHYFNYNFAFSLPLPKFLIYLLYAVILAAIGWYVYKYFPRFKTSEKLAWVLIIAGALSNVGERILLGYVRDFIYVLSGVFNLADGYIVAGVAILLLNSFVTRKNKPTILNDKNDKNK